MKRLKNWVGSVDKVGTVPLRSLYDYDTMCIYISLLCWI
jgi:hypothetical protein